VQDAGAFEKDLEAQMSRLSSDSALSNSLRSLGGFATKSERVYDVLRDAILDGQLSPGSRINLSQTAVQLGTSETPVREALKRLESERLVVVEPHAGFLVAEISLGELIENLLLRREVEALATRLAASAIDASDIKELHRYIEQMDAEAKLADWHAYARTNKRFHLALISRCPLPVIRRTAIELWEIGERSRWLFIQNPRTEGSNREHRLMVEAIEDGDTAELGELVRQQKAASIRVALALMEGPEREKYHLLVGTPADEAAVDGT
jgi:DNA-binding GntR family transcriptional regulator